MIGLIAPTQRMSKGLVIKMDTGMSNGGVYLIRRNESPIYIHPTNNRDPQVKIKIDAPQEVLVARESFVALKAPQIYGLLRNKKTIDNSTYDSLDKMLRGNDEA